MKWSGQFGKKTKRAWTEKEIGWENMEVTPWEHGVLLQVNSAPAEVKETVRLVRELLHEYRGIRVRLSDDEAVRQISETYRSDELAALLLAILRCHCPAFQANERRGRPEERKITNAIICYEVLAVVEREGLPLSTAAAVLQESDAYPDLDTDQIDNRVRDFRKTDFFRRLERVRRHHAWTYERLLEALKAGEFDRPWGYIVGDFFPR